MKIKIATIIIMILVIVFVTSCNENNSDEIPSATPVNSETEKPIINIEDVLTEIPYDVTFPEKAGLITNNQYYRIVKFENSPRWNKGDVKVFYQRGCNEGKLVYTYCLGQTKEHTVVFKYGLMNENFNKFTEADYDKINSFSDGCAIVKKNDLYGVVKEDGILILDCIYEKTPEIGLQMVRVETSRDGRDKTFDYFDKEDGEFLFTVEKTYDMQTRMYKLHIPKKDGSKELIEYIPEWDDEPIHAYIDGETNLWGYKDNNGNIITEAIFQETHPFCEGRAVVKLDGKYGYINEYGEVVIEAVYDMAYDFSEGVAKVYSGRRYGYIDDGGNILLDFKYVKAGDFRDGLAAVKSFGVEYNYINAHGEIIINGDFAFAGNFSNGVAPVQDQVKGRYRYIDIQGNTVFNSMTFDTADEINEDGYAFATQMSTIAVENLEEGWEGTSGVYDIYLIYLKPEQ